MKRVQRKRTKGFKTPENTVYCGRPTKWGNPFRVDEFGQEKAVEMFKEALLNNSMCYYYLGEIEATAAFNHIKYISENMNELKGKNLSCFCSLDKPCHVDVLLNLLS